MTTTEQFVIVGAGLAGAKLAEALRGNDFAGNIVLLGAEDRLPYERPPLSKEFLAGKKELPEFTTLPASWYRDHQIQVRLGTEVRALDPTAKTVTLPGGEPLRYSKLALATGSRPRRLPIPGAQRALLLRSFEDAERLRATLDTVSSLVVIGAGWIGLEVTAAARDRGIAVTIVETAQTPLSGALGPQMGQMFADLHRAHGVEFRFGARVTEVTSAGAVLDDGTVITAEAVLMAVGAQPNTELAKAAGLAVDGGVLVDARLATSNPDIVAVGDIAAEQHPVLDRRIRVEHWANALNQPAVAAMTMLGRAASYDRQPYFFTDQYDVGMEYRGYASPDDTVVVRGDVAAHEFVAYWTDPQGRAKAAMNVNVWDKGDEITAILESGATVS